MKIIKKIEKNNDKINRRYDDVIFECHLTKEDKPLNIIKSLWLYIPTKYKIERKDRINKVKHLFRAVDVMLIDDDIKDNWKKWAIRLY